MSGQGSKEEPSRSQEEPGGARRIEGTQADPLQLGDPGGASRGAGARNTQESFRFPLGFI